MSGIAQSPAQAKTDSWLGLMSGTSLDAVDAAIACFEPEPALIATHSEPIPSALRMQTLAAIQHPDQVTLQDIGQLDAEWGDLLGQAAQNLIEASGLTPKAIGSHGQTLWHGIDEAAPFTWQIGDPNRITARTGIDTIADFRRQDIAWGGQGAPLAPAFHAEAFAHPTERRAIINIGGFANVTLLNPNESVSGFDTGPGNCLMDAWCLQHLNKPFDENGAWASSGSCIQSLLKQTLNDPYFALPPPKSTGREYFNLDWLQQYLAGDEVNQDVQATLLELTATSISNQLIDIDRAIICGGGAHNGPLMQRLIELNPKTAVVTTAEHGIGPDWIEATAFAWLAMRTSHNLPGNLPSVTGATKAVVLGGHYPTTKT